MHEIDNPEVAKVFHSYPESVRQKLLYLRELIIRVAHATPGVGDLEETLKWGEPSYLARRGSTVRLGWKAAAPDRYALYFNCRTKLVDTFREIYPDDFEFEGNRAIVFRETGTLPAAQVEHCIALSLTYHRVKHLPLLGA